MAMIDKKKIQVNFESDAVTRTFWRHEALKRDIPLSELLHQAMNSYLLRDAEDERIINLINWLEDNSEHITFVRSATGKNFRMYSSRHGGQVIAATLRECIEKMRIMCARESYQPQ